MSSSLHDWSITPEAQPQAGDYRFDLDRALSSVVELTARVPDDAFTAPTLGTERAGNGVIVREDGIVLTIGYLITEASEVWLTTASGKVVAGHVLGIDAASGFGLVQALGDLGMPAIPLGDSRRSLAGQQVVVGAAGGASRAIAATVLARQEFAGYWEYVLDQAIFTTPAHPHWGGAAMIGPDGSLLGIGSLQLQQEGPGGRPVPINMIVPIELLEPVFEDLLRRGRPDRPARPWLGLFASDSEDRVIVIGLAGNGPARKAGLREGDAILAVGDEAVEDLADFFRAVWRQGAAGVDIPLTLDREGDVFDVRITSSDRDRMLKTAPLH